MSHQLFHIILLLNGLVWKYFFESKALLLVEIGFSVKIWKSLIPETFYSIFYHFLPSNDCNGHPPLNNQRALSPQNSLKGRALREPKNSFKRRQSWSRNNSVGSGRSICNSFELSRQNSFTSHRTLNSLGSGNSKDDNKTHKNIVDLPDVKIALDKQEGKEAGDNDEEADPDIIDETVRSRYF